MRTIITAALCLALSLPALAADPASQPSSAPKIQYDKFKDVTTAETPEADLQPAKGPGRHIVKFSVTYPGKEPRKAPDKIRVNVVAASGTGIYGANPKGIEFILLVDGERIRLPLVDFSPARGSAPVYEGLGFNLSVEQLKKLAAAGKVEGQIGQTEFAFRDRDLQAFKEFAKAVKATE